MFDIIKKTGLSVAEVAQIVSISRVALFNWKAKRTKPHPQFQRRLETFTVFLERRIQAKQLPLSEDYTKAERKAKVAQLKDLFNRVS
jgi:hypothetical protein